MTWWEKLKAAFAREAADLEEMAEDARRALDAKLTEKERELEASPAERLDMIIEDIEEEDRRFGELTSGLKTGVDRMTPTPAAESHSPTDPAAGRASIVHPDTVSSSPHLSTALSWVSIQVYEDAEVLESEGLYDQFDHHLWIEEWVGPVIGDQRLMEIEQKTREHPLVDDALHEDREVLFVRAPTLSHDDVRLIVAGALADHIPDDWESRLG